MAYIRVNNLNKTYDQFPVLQGITFDIQKGKITAIAGASGSGKTTLLKAIYGLISAEYGTVFIDEEKVPGPEDKLIPGHDQMKLIDQQFELNWHASVWDNVSSRLPNTDLTVKNFRTEKLLHRLRISHLKDKKVNDLSGGEKQRVSIARALADYPDVLLMDEPFNQLDSSFREFLQQDIRNYVRETGLTVVLVSHDPAEVLSLADELIIIQNGKILEKGDPKKLYRSPQNMHTAQLLGNGNILNTYAAGQCGVRTQSEFIMAYPEWIAAGKSFWGGKTFLVKEVLFKGFYEELLVEKDDVQLRVLNRKPGAYKHGDTVDISIKKYAEMAG
ncbi:MAG: ABC transporter ATP-binding protein [Mucilaginibacter polytrichastri]|nr:ABC transporter ATP-binding protein [Mucilaginibacter polytrichastri]